MCPLRPPRWQRARLGHTGGQNRSRGRRYDHKIHHGLCRPRRPPRPGTEGYECIPNDLMLAASRPRDEKPKDRLAFNIAPIWHPLRLAEDFATADILTGGRTIFGVGRGYHTREVETFDAPMLNQEANRELFEEQVEIIFKAFNEE